eukprot:TRINITY_DN1061_c4_g1_i2.p1 TRINITY_DN1061_c4_g1~~TRINITY_DN1061_c4_g1_i2.p1  ORF type:complete len:226 (+),score=59.23 TRINITY_DN1061_c4_g1_i2:449-1126(+)
MSEGTPLSPSQALAQAQTPASPAPASPTPASPAPASPTPASPAPGELGGLGFGDAFKQQFDPNSPHYHNSDDKRVVPVNAEGPTNVPEGVSEYANGAAEFVAVPEAELTQSVDERVKSLTTARTLLTNFKKTLAGASAVLARKNNEAAWSALVTRTNEELNTIMDNEECVAVVQFDGILILVGSMSDRNILKVDEFVRALQVETSRVFRGMKALLEEIKKAKKGI